MNRRERRTTASLAKHTPEDSAAVPQKRLSGPLGFARWLFGPGVKHARHMDAVLAVVLALAAWLTETNWLWWAAGLCALTAAIAPIERLLPMIGMKKFTTGG